MMIRQLLDMIPAYRNGLARQEALSAGGAQDSSPGRKPGVTVPFLKKAARKSGRQNVEQERLRRSGHACWDSVAPTGLTSLNTIFSPGLRPGLHCAARLRGLIESFLNTGQRGLRPLKTFMILVAVIAIAYSTLQLNVMAEKNRGMNSAD